MISTLQPVATRYNGAKDNFNGPSTSSPGSGRLHLSNPSRAHFSSLLASYPLKLLAPTPLHSQPRNLGIAYTLAYGGGLVAGDCVQLAVEIDAGCALVLLTQGSTKVFKHRPGIRPLSHPRPASVSSSESSSYTILTRQRLHVALSPSSLLLLLPDSVSPFRDSQYAQAQRIVLPECGTASALVFDWVNSGRGQRPMGQTVKGVEIANDDLEVWAMGSYMSTNEVVLGEKVVMRERMVLDNAEQQHDPTTTPATVPTHMLSRVARRLAPYHVYATLLIYGPHLAALLDHLAQISDQTSQFQQPQPPGLLWSFSPVCDGGGVIRVAALEVEDVRRWVRGVLEGGGVHKLVGEGMWPRCI